MCRFTSFAGKAALEDIETAQYGKLSLIFWCGVFGVREMLEFLRERTILEVKLQFSFFDKSGFLNIDGMDGGNRSISFL